MRKPSSAGPPKGGEERSSTGGSRTKYRGSSRAAPYNPTHAFKTAGLLGCAGGFALGLAACRSPEGVARSSQVGQPPVAEKRPKTVTVHGDSRVDDYFWLRDKEDRQVLDELTDT